MSGAIGTGFIVGIGALTGFTFDPSLPYAGCRICGKVYQGEALKVWQDQHNRKHTEKEHLALAGSGLWSTPEAAQKLAAFGVINFGDLVMSDEIAHALRVANSTPTDNPEGPTKSGRN